MGLVDSMGLGIVLSWQNRMTGEITRAQRDLAGLERSAKGTTERIRQEAENTRIAMERYRAGMWSSVKMVGAGLAIAAPFVWATKEAANLEEGLANVKAVLVGKGMVDEDAELEVRKLKEAILDMAGTTLVPMEELVGVSRRLVAQLGMIQGIAALKPSADLAVAGLSKISESVDLLLPLLATYGARMDATLTPAQKLAQIANIVAGGINMSGGNLNDLAGALTQASAESSTLDIDLTELVTILGTLQQKGLAGTMAGSAFTMMLSKLLMMQARFSEGSKESAMSMSEFSDAIAFGAEKGKGQESLLERVAGKLKGLDIKDAQGRMRSIFDILDQIEKRFGINAEKIAAVQKELGSASLGTAEGLQKVGFSADEAAALIAVFGAKGAGGGAQALFILLSETQAMREQARALEKTNSLQKQVIEREKGVNAQFKMTKERLKALTIEIGDIFLPTAESMIETLKRGVTWLREFAKAHPDETKWASWTAAGVVGLLAVGGTVRFVAYLLGGLGILLKGLGITSLVAFGGWAVAIGVVAGAIYMLIKNWDEITARVKKFIDAIESAKTTWESFKAGATTWFEDWKKTLEEQPDWLRLLQGPVPNIAAVGTNLVNTARMFGSFATPRYGGVPTFINLPSPVYGPPSPAEILRAKTTETVTQERTEHHYHHGDTTLTIHVHPPKGASAEDTARAVERIFKDKAQRSPQGKR